MLKALSIRKFRGGGQPINAFRIAAPFTVHGTSFQEYFRADAGSVMDSISLNIVNNAGCCICHNVKPPIFCWFHHSIQDKTLNVLNAQTEIRVRAKKTLE